MSRFSEKVKHARLELGLTQPELGAAVGVSLRTILAYEKGEKEPRAGTLLKLAKALKVSSRFLKDDDCDDPMEEIEKDSYIMDARRQYGTRGEKQIRELMNDSVALMAGGEISEEEKEKTEKGKMKTTAEIFIVCLNLFFPLFFHQVSIQRDTPAGNIRV